MGRKNGDSRWLDEDTELFLKYGHIFTPERESMMHSFLNLIPAEKNEHFTLVDIGVGGG